MKKARNFVIILLAAVVLIIALGSERSKDKQKEAESSAPKGSDVIAEEETAPLIEEVMGVSSSVETPSNKEELREAFDKSFDDGVPIFYDSVRNDVTGKWRRYICATPNNIVDFAVDYYNAYFEDDSEIHFVVNFQLGTTTRISKIGNMLDLTTHEYVDKEEHYADTLASGMVLSQTQVTIQ